MKNELEAALRIAKSTAEIDEEALKKRLGMDDLQRIETVIKRRTGFRLDTLFGMSIQKPESIFRKFRMS